MCTKFKSLYYFLFILIVLGNSFIMITDTYAQKPEDSLYWTIESPKKIFYLGEAVPLTLNITNIGKKEEKVDFGSDGLEAFSMEIRDSNNTIVVKGEKISRDGVARIGTLNIGLDETGKKTIVLNRWCSTLLPPGKYYIRSQVEYRLRSEATKKPNTINTYLSGPLHQIQLNCNIELIKPDPAKYKEILDNLAKYEIENNQKPFNEWKQERELAREMIAFTESDLAVPYQIQNLKKEQTSWIRIDLINSLVKSKTLDAAKGLMDIMTDTSVYKEDIKKDIINGVYILRETGKAEIISATDDFVKNNKRSAKIMPID
jgi:hypothetical protein